MVVGAKVCELTDDFCGLYVGILTSPLTLHVMRHKTYTVWYHYIKHYLPYRSLLRRRPPLISVTVYRQSLSHREMKSMSTMITLIRADGSRREEGGRGGLLVEGALSLFHHPYQ